jgi:hypothetical protein
MSSNKSKNINSKNRKNKIATISVLFIVSIILLFDTLSPFGGNIRFYIKWYECRRKPVSERVTLTFGAVPKSYENSQIVTAYRMQARYFCTPLEAEKAGYSANPYRMDFPNLDMQQNTH